MLGVALVGYGYWGPNLARNFNDVCDLVAIHDRDVARLEDAEKLYPKAEVTTHWTDALRNPDVDAVVIATPPDTHCHIAREALRAGKHVFVEKPLAMNSADAEMLVRIADDKELTLMVDHTFLYTSAVQRMKEMLDEQVLGPVYVYDSSRVNWGRFSKDANVVWDLAVHDFAILDYLFPEKPTAISAVGSYQGSTPFAEGISRINVVYPGTMDAYIQVSWLHPFKQRLITVSGQEGMLVYDDTLSDEYKLKFHKKRLLWGDSPLYDDGGLELQELVPAEALRRAALHFSDCVYHKDKPISDGHSGLRVVRMLEAATRSMRFGQTVGMREAVHA